MESIAQLRQKLQEPRRSVDTWYGRTVMRRLSIYLTWFFVQLEWTPNQVTLLSLVSALVSSLFFVFAKNYFAGIVFLNLWYLLDHVDGEVARLTQKSSVTGFFFDTVINFIVQPITFFSLGFALQGKFPQMLYWGIFGAFGYLMLMILPVCEDAVLLHLWKQNPPGKTGTLPLENSSSSSKSFGRRIFAVWHKGVLYPNLLLTLTCLFLVAFFTRITFESILFVLLIFYAFSSNLIWILQLIHIIAFQKMDLS